jgi:nitroimidazol reductase NimA-like FMN-containing flavoprotein (pyridoxamine 5'-phosphate oxidase superfamily)
LTLLLGATVGRLAFIGRDGAQELMPVNIVAFGGEVYFRTSPTGPFATLADGRENVALGVDHFDSVVEQGWNVTARGRTERAAESAATATVAGSSLTPPWAGGDRPQLVRFVIEEIDGRRVSRR